MSRNKNLNIIRSISEISDLDVLDTFSTKFYPFICRKIRFYFEAKARVKEYSITYRNDHLLSVLEWLNFSIIEFFLFLF